MFITFEGGEGCGKSTQSTILYQKLVSLGKNCILTHEPGGTEIGEEICKLLKTEHTEPIDAMTELLLFNASRSQIVKQVIKPALEKDIIVICDRYTDSTLAYQGYARGLDLNTIEEANKLGCENLIPDITFFMNMNPKDSFQRKADKYDRIEQESLSFHEKVRQGFIEIAKKNPTRIMEIDASQDINTISEIIWNKINKIL